MTLEHGGNIYEVARLLGCQPSDIIDMSSFGIAIIFRGF